MTAGPVTRRAPGPPSTAVIPFARQALSACMGFLVCACCRASFAYRMRVQHTQAVIPAAGHRPSTQREEHPTRLRGRPQSARSIGGRGETRTGHVAAPGDPLPSRQPASGPWTLSVPCTSSARTPAAPWSPPTWTWPSPAMPTTTSARRRSLVRDGKLGNSPAIEVTGPAWSAFVSAVAKADSLLALTTRPTPPCRGDQSHAVSRADLCDAPPGQERKGPAPAAGHGR